MVINKDSLAARVNNISKKYGIDASALYSRYFFDCFLSRLAKSEYADLFILKGGLYLSLIFGIENRVTKDMDFSLRRIKMDRDTVAGVIKTICEESSDDAVHFCYLGESPIKKDDVYGGFSVVLEGRLGNVKQRFEMDLGAGDCIYPHECECDYECIITKERLRIKSYSVESVLAEKLQAFLSLGTSNSRSKDFYDLYVLEKFKMNETNEDSFRKAFIQTCYHRKFVIDREKAMIVFQTVKNNTLQRKRWETYARKARYTSGTSYDDLMDAINKIILAMF